ncbi:PD-(D/E)XK nuclease family protein [Candidatus Poriferisodalis sp.]|uniref:PD-(D/E)XK nuclease family protein n=1 Tax=Candidatus Poriferisodalis sp. TaxID=3101277 RepID=UPI003B010DB8
MEDDHSLLAHLVPKLTRGVEDAATDALAFILNKSEACREALVEMVCDGERRLASVASARTQVVASEGERLDLVAYDTAGSNRLIIESKFWAPLQDGQARRYVGHLADDGLAVLLFVAPEVRHETLWVKIARQFEHPSELKLGSTRQVRNMIVADVLDGGKRIALMGWDTLLAGLTNADSSMDANLQQLHGLALAQDEAAFAPLHAEDLNATVPRRLMAFNRLVDGVASRGAGEGWMTNKGLKAVPGRDGYLRYIGFCDADGERLIELALYVSLKRWADLGTTPLWLRIWHKQAIDLEDLKHGLAEPGWLPAWSEPNWLWVPIELPLGVEYEDTLDSATAQVKRVRDIVVEMA